MATYGELQKGLLTKILRDAETFKNADVSKRTVSYAKSRSSMLEADMSIARGYHEEIFSKGKLEKTISKDEVTDVYNKISDAYLEYNADLLSVLDAAEDSKKLDRRSIGDVSTPAAGSKRSLPLPVLKHPPFSGSYCKWRSFHDFFVTAIHSDDEISDLQKLHHLKSCLSGEAERLLQHLSLEAGNYKKAWELLTGRYDNKRVLIHYEFKLLFGQSALGKESVNGLRSILDTSTEAVHSLENLGLPVEHWDAILIYVLFQKLPTLTQQLWEEKLSSSKDLPTFRQFLEFLEARFRTLEAVTITGNQSSTRPSVKADQPKVFHAKANLKSQFQCKVCSQGQHSLRKCRKFLAMEAAQRQQAARMAKVCENCLAYSHASRDCPSIKTCYFCQQRHHTLLHIGLSAQVNQTTHTHAHAQSHTHNSNTERPHFSGHTNTNQLPVNPEADVFVPRSEESGNEERRTFFASNHRAQQVLLATAVVKALSADGSVIYLRALIDPGSEASFITESAVQRLRLPKHRTSIEVSGLGKVSSGACKHFVDLAFTSCYSTFGSAVKAFIFKSLTGLLPAQRMTLDNLTHIKGLQLADPRFFVPASIDLLLGSDIYAEIVLPDIVRDPSSSSLIAQRTELGWIVLGKIPDETMEPRRLRTFAQMIDLDTEMRRFWEIEETPFKIKESEEDAACEKQFQATTRRLSDGRYEVTLPFKEGRHPELGASMDSALRRFAQLERRFQRDPMLHSRYRQCIMEYLTLQHMEEVDLSNDLTITSPYHFFLPHHAVFKEASSTTKLRVVFDAAAKTVDGTSLNDHLMIGPKLQKDIVELILRWRRHRFTFTGDIEKMYRQISVSSEDRYYQIILWRNDATQPIKAYKLKTVTFGTAPAPYLAIRTLNRAADDGALEYPMGAKVVQEDMYVDDLISGADTVEEALQKRDEARQLLASAGFNLRKWTCNDKELVRDIPEEDCELDFELPLRASDNVKTLGVRWFPKSDSFSFQNFQSDSEEVTKRTMLSAIAKLFDPLGWISPCVIRAKIMMQQLWLKGSDWDQPIPTELQNEWNIFSRELPQIECIKIPRWVNTHKTCQAIELHGFSDASTKAYGAAIYVRVLDSEGATHMHLLMSKTKVAPLKTISLPRLELCGAVILATLLKYSAEALNLPDAKVYAWSDSTITLAWIQASPSRWSTFVSNRVSEVQRLTNCSIWRHVQTHHNPADLASRGISPSTLADQDLWWKGPSFLNGQWDFTVPDQPTAVTTEEEKRSIKSHCATTKLVRDAVVNRLLNKTDTLIKLLRILALCKRFTHNYGAKPGFRKIGALDPCDIRSALLSVVIVAQRDMFPTELEEFGKCSTTPKTLRQLNAFIDGNGIIRVGGRLQNANLTYNQRHPIILKPNHHFTDLVIRNAHEQTHHGGTQQTAAYVRHTYWVLQLKRCVKKHIHRCMACFRQKAEVMEQLMGTLPKGRVTVARPFSNTGVDYAGPIDIKAWKGRGAKMFKGYFAIFICLATKAVHLEAVTDLTTQAFLAAFRRFTSRRGLCSEIFSDCGTNFVGADRELRRLMKEAKHDWIEVANSLANQGTKWNFIPPAAPHFGGLWEAGVKSVKHHLKRVVRDEKLTFEELSTLLTQVEACLNSRPLCPLTNNPDDLDILTPGHFLIGEPLLTVPQGDILAEKLSYLDRWKRVQGFVRNFWQKWSGEYLARLQQRPKWNRRESAPKVGDLVLIKDERLPPSQWLLARITETHPGVDKLIRVVTLKTKNGLLKRPIAKICYLPTNKTCEDNTII